MIKYSLLIISLILTQKLLCHNGFIQNRGQIRNQNSERADEVLFLLSQKGMNVQLRADGFSYDVMDWCLSENNLSTEEEIRTHRVDIRFLNCNNDLAICPKNQRPEIFHYYTSGSGEMGVTNVRAYDEIIYQNLYPGIDVEFKLNATGDFEYDFVLHPGADPSNITLQYNGQYEMYLTDKVLSLQLDFGILQEKIPCSYYRNSNKLADISYVLDKNIIRFSGLEIIAQTLIIDPTPNLVYATYFGGENQDWIEFAESDMNGFMYTLGKTNSTLNIATTGGFQNVIGSESGYDLLIQKWDSFNELIWSTYFGGSGNEFSGDLKISNNDEVIIAGSTQSNNQISSINAFQETFGGVQDCLLAKFNSDGTRDWSTYFGGNNFDQFNCIDLDSNRIICGGSTGSNDIAMSQDAWMSQLAGNNDALFAIWDFDGQPIFTSLYGGNSSDGIVSTAIDSQGNILFAGVTSSTDFPLMNPASSVYGGGSLDGFVVKSSPNQDIIFSSYLGGSQNEVSISLDCDDSDNIFVLMQTNSPGLSTTGAYQVSVAGEYDANISRISPSGVRESSTYFGGNRTETIGQVKCFGSGIYICGSTNSISNISTSQAFQTDLHNLGLPDENEFDGFVSLLNQNLNELSWSTYLGNNNADAILDIFISNNELYAFGTTTDVSELPSDQQETFVTSNAFQIMNHGVFDGFIARFDNVVGVAERTSEAAISLFPNPTSGVVQMQLPRVDTWDIQIVDRNGRTVISKSVVQKSQLAIDLSNQAAGLYVIRAFDKNGEYIFGRVMLN